MKPALWCLCACVRLWQANSSILLLLFLGNQKWWLEYKWVVVFFPKTRHVREAAVIIHIVSRLSHQRDCIMDPASERSVSLIPFPLWRKMHNCVVMTTCYSDGIKWFHTQGKCKSDWLCIMHPDWCAHARWECWWVQDEFPSKQILCRVSRAPKNPLPSQFLLGMCRWGSIFPKQFFSCIFRRMWGFDPPL